MEMAVPMAVEADRGSFDAVADAAPRTLASLRPGEHARVLRLQMPGSGHGHDRNTVLRLLEIGFVEGERVRVVALGPGGAEPLAVRVGSSLFALRRHEAEHVVIETDPRTP